MYSLGHTSGIQYNVVSKSRLYSDSTCEMPKKGKLKRTRRLRGRGAYYPGGQAVLRGKGGFFGDLWGGVKSIGGPLLNAVGAVGDAFIPGAGQVANGIKRLVGMGAYTPVSGNSILAQPVPAVGSSQDQGVRYRHQEYLGDVTTSATWELTQFHVNPGLPETFPWLSTIANSFQKYRINGLVFYIRSTSSVAIASTDNLALGTVLGAHQYSAYDRPPTSKVDFLALSGSLSGKPSEDHIYPLECDPKKNVFKNLLVRHTGVSDDLQKYDHAIFNLATTGAPGEYPLGELWVSYDITLMAPKTEDAAPYMWGTAVEVTELTKFKVDGNHAPAILPKSMADVKNTLDWNVANASDGEPALAVPAGTSGYFNVQCVFVSSTGDFTGSVNLTDYIQVVGDGTCTPLAGAGLPVAINIMTGSPAHMATLSFAVHVAAPPDKPMYLRIGVGWEQTGDSPPVASFIIQRLSDHFIPDVTTGSGVVAPRLKVRRGNRTDIYTRSDAKPVMALTSQLGLTSDAASAVSQPALAAGLAAPNQRPPKFVRS